MFCEDLTLTQADSYSFRKFISAPVLVHVFLQHSGFILGQVVLLFFLQRIQGK